MRNATKSFWILLFAGMAFLLGRCGRLSNQPKDDLTPEDILYIPGGWEGEDDWPENALKVEDIAQ